ncbi:fungal-specific transcription factor domain-containing protein [Gymnopilus junonius]|uniref:Fungal-specific transcription factor domain-containing protein n=1 Tax=Gymnopilus junonius TaxID=109634 RepID=A0A9P5TLM2_GYMJU|nr:fungal-specific transcription factor domain-containing protein [Gymnopilus junonius]
MPVDTTRVISPRRTQKKLTEEELKEIDRKRLLGELSCAECRRLKLKCDKKLPCGSCYRRGCESICPLGILAAGQGTRFILADTAQLHEKIYEMSNRIRQLEDGLAILQSTVSDQRHPLLTDELLKIKFGSEAINPHQPTSDEDTQMNKTIDALGTLTLGSSGEMQYFGRSAGSERAGEEAEDSSGEDHDEAAAPPQDAFADIEKLANLFPFTGKGRPNVNGLALIEMFLPSFERASQLCDSYIKHATYFFRPIKPDDLLDILFPSIYKRIATRSQDAANGDHNTPHALASLCFIFALGCVLDLTRLPYNSEAERYYDLGRAALSLKSVYDSPNMDSVKAMGLMATYHSLAGKKYSRDSAWCVMSFAAKLAQSVHRDSARWNMDPKTVQRRRNLFWEVFSADVSHSLALGRPPAIHLSYVDCEFPIDDDASLSRNAEHQMGFWRMKHTFAKDIYNSVAEATLTAHAPSYNTILDLDRKVREISFPASFNPYVKRGEVGDEVFHSSSLSLRDFYASQHRTVTMIYLHRSFFAQAMLDHPTNPLLSPFAPSFLTAYRSASVIIKASVHLFERCAEMAMRLWFLMYHTFSAAVSIVGTVVTRSPNTNISSIAMRDFSLALSLFERTAAQSQRAKIALAVLLQLKEKALRAYELASKTAPPGVAGMDTGAAEAARTISSPIVDDTIEDDLAIFGGQMRVLDRKGKGHGHGITGGDSRSSPSLSASSASVSPTMGSSQVPGASSSNSSIAGLGTGANAGFGGNLFGGLGFGLDLPDVHPSLITYLNQDAVRRAVAVGQGRAGQGQRESTGAAVMTGTGGVAGGTGPGVGNLNTPISISIPEAPVSGKGSDKVLGGGFGTFGPPLASRRSILDPSREWSSSFTGFGGNGQGSPVSLPGLGNLQNTPTQHQQQPTYHLPVPSSATGANLMASNFGNQQLPSQWDFNNYQGSQGPFMTSGMDLDVPAGFDDVGAGWMNIGMNSDPRGNVNVMDPMGVVEMGLSSESGMDAGWMSFMRDCGIMDSTGTGNEGR